MGTTAWILPGGSNLAAAQVGQAAALIAAGHAPDLVIGCSAGSLNAALIAADPTPRGLEVLRRGWSEVRRRDVFPFRPVGVALGLAGRRDHLVSNRRLATWLGATIPYSRLEEARLPLTVTATDLDRGEPVYLRSGPVVPALLASCALPGTFPPVEVDGRMLVDGAVLADLPVDQAVAQGADRVWVLSTVADQPGRRARSAMGMVMRTVEVMLGNAGATLLSAWADRAEIYVVPAPGVPRSSPFGFERSAEVMDLARQRTEAWLPVARPLGSTVRS